MDIPRLLQSLFNDKDQDVMAIYDADESCIKAWKVERLKEAAKNIKTTEIKLSTLKPKLSSWFGNQDKDVELAELKSHIERVQDANIAFPIIVLNDNRVIDGTHRYLRALLEGKTVLPCKHISVLPAPDMVIPISADGKKIIVN